MVDARGLVLSDDELSACACLSATRTISVLAFDKCRPNLCKFVFCIFLMNFSLF